MTRATVKTCEQCGKAYAKDQRYSPDYFARQRFCSAACSGAYKRACKEAKDMRTEFYRWVDKSGDCWLWTGARDKDGYGAFSFHGKTRRAHRVSLALDGVTIPAGHYACHKCDNPSCVNPAHLYAGSPSDNMRDAAERDRLNNGERNHHAKLTADAVRTIRTSPEACGVLARRFGVTHGAVSMARSGKTWRHIA
jgi:hypothetical protein